MILEGSIEVSASGSDIIVVVIFFFLMSIWGYLLNCYE